MHKFTTEEWSPAIEAAAEAIYERLTRMSWSEVDDIDVRDHYCFAARNAVVAFHNQAARNIEVEVT